MKAIQNVSVLGAGRWGTAMAIYLSRKGLNVTLQCHLQSEYDQLIEKDVAPNLPNFTCDKKIAFEMDIDKAVQTADMIIIAIPVAFLRSTLKSISHIPENAVIVSINKGIERESLKTVPEIIEEFFPSHDLAHLGGPCFPDGLLSDTTLVAETLACKDSDLGLKLQKIFSTQSFRVYGSQDLKGVAVLGALKNVYAIIAGIAEGYGMYEEVISVIVTRGLSEMKRYCNKENISLETLYGLSGLGDLALTCYSPANSHNKNFGLKMGQGMTTQEIIDSMNGTVAEGYYTTKAIFDISQKLEIDLPLCTMAYQAIYKSKPIKACLQELMSRPLKLED